MPEIKQARQINSQVEQILSDAQDKAQDIIDRANDTVTYMQERSAFAQLEKVKKDLPQFFDQYGTYQGKDYQERLAEAPKLDLDHDGPVLSLRR
jgi:hypothetical protein